MRQNNRDLTRRTLFCLTLALAIGGCGRSEPASTSSPHPAAEPADSGGATAPPSAPAHGETLANPKAAATPEPLASAGTPANPAPAWHEVTVPAGTRLSIVLETPVGSDISRVEQPVRARLEDAVIVGGEQVVPANSEVSGAVTEAARSGKVKGRAHVAVRFTTLTPRGDDAGEHYSIATAAVARTAAATKQKDALEIGGPAAGGALIGALVGGKKGALVGTAIGGGAGTAVVMSTRGKEVRLARGTPLTLQLERAVTIRVRGR